MIMEEQQEKRKEFEDRINKEDEKSSSSVWIEYADFEVCCNEIERARKQYGNAEVDDVIEGKRYYEHEVRKKPCGYRLWFGYIGLLQHEEEESEGKDYRLREKIREVYERAIANVPTTGDKRHWRSYISLCIDYAVYEELDARDFERARRVYFHCLRMIPKEQFCARMWILAATFEIRQLNLEGARAIFGTAVSMKPSDEILLNQYITMELQLGNVDHCRKIYERYIKLNKQNIVAWIRYAWFEAHQGSRHGGIEREHCIQRARRVFERASNYFTAYVDIITLQEVWLDMEASFGVLGDVNLVRSRLPKKLKRGQ